MALAPNILAKIANARATTGGNIIKDGKYLLTIEKISIESKFRGTMFIAEFYVKKSEKTLANIEPNAVGSTCSIVLNLDEPRGIGAGNAKAFVLNLLGYDEPKGPIESPEVQKFLAEFQETLAKLIEPAQPVRGMLVNCETFRKVTQTGVNAGKEATYPRFSSVPQKPEEIAASRNWLDQAHKETPATA